MCLLLQVEAEAGVIILVEVVELEALYIYQINL
jgi:hypothetical protein